VRPPSGRKFATVEASGTTTSCTIHPSSVAADLSAHKRARHGADPVRPHPEGLARKKRTQLRARPAEPTRAQAHDDADGNRRSGTGRLLVLFVRLRVCLFACLRVQRFDVLAWFSRLKTADVR
jgi:hypothetical protein